MQLSCLRTPRNHETPYVKIAAVKIRPRNLVEGGSTKKIVLASLLIGVLWIWCCVAADYGYRAVSGTYTFEQGPERSTLILHRDQLFEQELKKAGQVERTHGTWRRTGEGSVVFSNDFLIVTGQEATRDLSRLRGSQEGTRRSIRIDYSIRA